MAKVELRDVPPPLKRRDIEGRGSFRTKEAIVEVYGAM
jgi:hypothetical protein